MGHSLEGHPAIPWVMIRVIDACEQPARSGAHGFRSHRPRSLLTLRKFCRIRVKVGSSQSYGIYSTLASILSLEKECEEAIGLASWPHVSFLAPLIYSP
jgi:hypothetical protein